MAEPTDRLREIARVLGGLATDLDTEAEHIESDVDDLRDRAVFAESGAREEFSANLTSLWTALEALHREAHGDDKMPLRCCTRPSCAELLEVLGDHFQTYVPALVSAGA